MTCNGIRCNKCGSCNTEPSEIDCFPVGVFSVTECYNCGNIMPKKKAG